MSIERFILIFIVVFFAASIFYIPQNSIRKALLSYLSFQATTWVISIILAGTNMVTFPVREFTKATDVNFTLQFVLFPTFFTWFILLYPSSRSFIFKAFHWVLFLSLPVCFIIFIALYTELYQFSKGVSFLSVINILPLFAFQFILCFVYISWFFKSSDIYEKGV